jgi:hypothetical protein
MGYDRRAFAAGLARWALSRRVIACVNSCVDAFPLRSGVRTTTFRSVMILMPSPYLQGLTRALRESVLQGLLSKCSKATYRPSKFSRTNTMSISS